MKNLIYSNKYFQFNFEIDKPYLSLKYMDFKDDKNNKNNKFLLDSISYIYIERKSFLRFNIFYIAIGLVLVILGIIYYKLELHKFILTPISNSLNTDNESFYYLNVNVIYTFIYFILFGILLILKFDFLKKSNLIIKLTNNEKYVYLINKNPLYKFANNTNITELVKIINNIKKECSNLEKKAFDFVKALSNTKFLLPRKKYIEFTNDRLIVNSKNKFDSKQRRLEIPLDEITKIYLVRNKKTSLSWSMILTLLLLSSLVVNTFAGLLSWGFGGFTYFTSMVIAVLITLTATLLSYYFLALNYYFISVNLVISTKDLDVNLYLYTGQYSSNKYTKKLLNYFSFSDDNTYIKTEFK